tara:strand:+ start:710 stop:1981 length:1272 start_codon:yes stop_codon:yes gene_type:complete
MPTDVSGTINIIAEVVGNSSSPIAGTGSSTTGKPSKEQQENQNWIKDIWKSSRKMLALLGIGGLLASSKIISSTMGSIMRIFGTFMDIIIAPIAPLLVRGLVILATVVMWVRKLLTGEGAWSDAWAGLKNWFIDTWNEKGGLWGVLKEGLANITGVALIAALFASIVATPLAGWWVMKQFFGAGKFLTKLLLKGALGLIKFAVTTPFKILKWTGSKLWNNLPMFAKRPFLKASALMGKMFAKGAIFTKALLRSAFGLVSWGISAAARAGKWSWNALMLGGSFVKIGAVRLMGMLGLTAMFSAAGAALGGFATAALPFALLGLIVIGAGISAAILFDMIWRRVFDRSFGDTLRLVDYAHQNPDFAEEHGISSFSAPTTNPWAILGNEYATGGNPLAGVIMDALSAEKDMSGLKGIEIPNPDTAQ